LRVHQPFAAAQIGESCPGSRPPQTVRSFKVERFSYKLQVMRNWEVWSISEFVNKTSIWFSSGCSKPPRWDSKPKKTSCGKRLCASKVSCISFSNSEIDPLTGILLRTPQMSNGREFEEHNHFLMSLHIKNTIKV
jgi:hypothetical protein